MYDYIYKTYGAQMDALNADKDQSYWFQQAAQVNEYLNDVNGVDPTPSAYFIQQINIESLKAAGLSSSDHNIARISNAIGERVYNDIKSGGLIPDLDNQVDSDISAAIIDGGLTVDQWGGSFYFWDRVLPEHTGTKTIGQYIADQGKIDNFVDMTSTAAARTIDIADAKWITHDPVTLNIDASEYLQAINDTSTAADLKLVQLFFQAEQRVGGAIDFQQAVNDPNIKLVLNSQGEYEAEGGVSTTAKAAATVQTFYNLAALA